MGTLELILADARTPSGSYAHSGGLEAAVAAAGVSVAEVPSFIRARLATVGRCEAALAARATTAESLEELLELDLEAAARTPAEPLRAASRQLGRALLRSAAGWWPDDRLLAAYRAASDLTPRPVALGAVARSGGLGPAAAARLSLYDDAGTVAAAAVKLMSLDSARATGWVVALSGEIDAQATEIAAGVTAATEVRGSQAADSPLPSTSTPLLDQRALIHARSDRRFFVS